VTLSDPTRTTPPATPATPPNTGAGAQPSRAGPPPGRWYRSRFFLLAVLGGAALAAGAYWWWDRHQSRRAWQDAEQALASRDLVTAAGHLDRYLSLRPDDAGGWFLASRTARRRGEFADASRYLSRYEKLGGRADAVQLERELALIQQGRSGDLDRRLRDSVGPEHPDVVFVLEALARGYIATDRRADALQACELWHTIQPDHPWPWLWAGLICERMGQMERAAALYRRALDLTPDDPDTRVAYARVLVRRRQPAPAAEHFEWVLARSPDDIEAVLGFAECLLDLSRADEATPLIDRALARDPNSPRALYLHGRAVLPRDPTGAEKALRRVVTSDPGDAEALYLLVQSLRAQGKDPEADQLGGRLEALRKDLDRLGEVLLQINAGLQDAAPCHEAGVIALRVGRTKEGVNFLHDALRRKGDHRPTHAALAEYYQKEGPPDLAAHHKRLAGLP
jgi:tetratricopeptide (TPR) repeat protein